MKGWLTILVCAIAAAGGYALRAGGFVPAGSVLFYVGVAGLIGSSTNKMAIDAMFSPWPSRRLALPYTGIIERKRRQIIDAIAATVAEQIVTPEALRAWMSESEFLDGLRDAGAEQVLSLAAAEGDGRELRSRIARAVQRHLTDLLDRDEAFFVVRDLVAEKAGPLGKVGHLTGLADYDVVAHEILDAIQGKLAAVLDEQADLPSGELAALLAAAAQRLKHWDIRCEPAVQKFVVLAAEKLQIRKIVIESLGRYSGEDIKMLIRSLSRQHLAWLEVYGGVFGAAGGFVLWLLT